MWIFCSHGAWIMRAAAYHCGAVVIQLSRQPTEVFECICSICRKLGVLWAYCFLDQVIFIKGQSATRKYIWHKRWIELHRCANCGCTIHWVPTDSERRRKMGVNARLVDGLNRTTIQLLHVAAGENNSFWTIRNAA